MVTDYVLKSFKINVLFFLAALFAMSGILTACTTVRPPEVCSVAEKQRLRKYVTPTEKRLRRKEAELSRKRKAATDERCVGSLFSHAVKSNRCTRLTSRIERLETEIETLQGRLLELNAALAGRPSSSTYVKSCKATWIIVRRTRKKPKSAVAPRKPWLWTNEENDRSIRIPPNRTRKRSQIRKSSRSTTHRSRSPPLRRCRLTSHLRRGQYPRCVLQRQQQGQGRRLIVLSGPISTSKSASSGPCACP